MTVTFDNALRAYARLNGDKRRTKRWLNTCAAYSRSLQASGKTHAHDGTKYSPAGKCLGYRSLRVAHRIVLRTL